MFLDVNCDFQVIQERKQVLKCNNKQTEEIFSEDDIFMGKKKRLAFLDLLIASSEDGKLLSDDDLQEEVNTFMFEVIRFLFSKNLLAGTLCDLTTACA